MHSNRAIINKAAEFAMAIGRNQKLSLFQDDRYRALQKRSLD